MRKVFILFFLAPVAIFSDVLPQLEELTYEWLCEFGKTTGKTDYIPYFKRIFNRRKIHAMLEFGVGLSTKYFLNSCDKVFSVEFVTRGYGPDSVRKFLKFYQSVPNWTPIIYFSGFEGDTSWANYKYFGSKSVYEADSYQCGTKNHYALIDDFYLKEIDRFVKNIIKINRINLVFVNPSNYLRSDLVQILFDKVPIIVAHNFSRDQLNDLNPYGYQRIQVPPNYEEICFKEGQGTVLWIHKDEQELIQELRNCTE